MPKVIVECPHCGHSKTVGYDVNQEPCPECNFWLPPGKRGGLTWRGPVHNFNEEVTVKMPDGETFVTRRGYGNPILST